MQIIELRRPQSIQNKKLLDSYTRFESLLKELRKKELHAKTVNAINESINKINKSTGSEKELRKKMLKAQSQIIESIEKNDKLVTKNHYRNRWLAIGMSAFGIPLGVAFGASLGNMAFLGVGLPIGMAIGIAVGTGMDKKALEEGRQIDFEVKN